MAATTTELEQDFRQRAIEAAGGISAEPIYRMVWDRIASEKLSGSVLDFGAGKGNLTRALFASGRFSSVTGVDALARPESLPADVRWVQGDLNEELALESFDVVIATEVIEHLENPRAVFRQFARLLKPSGKLILTMPNQESLRSYAALLIGGHFSSFLGASYPAHITALLRMDLERLCAETGFARPGFTYTDHGGIPKMPHVAWQRVLGRLARGRLFSDNLGMSTLRA